jgi:hypothetical protein
MADLVFLFSSSVEKELSDVRSTTSQKLAAQQNECNSLHLAEIARLKHERQSLITNRQQQV